MTRLRAVVGAVLRVTAGTARAILHGMPDAKTLPPGPSDEAALQYARELVATGADRTADFWAALERRHAEATHPVPSKAPRRA